MRIIVTGMIASYAFGGVAWDYVQYVEGFRRLGHDVYYLEDTGNWLYDPVHETISVDCSYNVQYLSDLMAALGLGGRWVYRHASDGSYYGMSRSDAENLFASAELFVNVSGSTWLRPEYDRIPRKIFIDTDPMFTQVNSLREEREWVKAHDLHFTFAENISSPDCRIPCGAIQWIPTRQPVVLSWWDVPPPEESRDVFTTVMSWVSYKECKYEGESWGQKDVEFRKFGKLPSLCAQPFEMAIALGPGKLRPTEWLRTNGWKVIEPTEVLPDLWSYRAYLAGSKAEWSVAKEGYVKSRSGWFSCRSACFLALGKPCVLQDTGWSRYYPSGLGLFAFSSVEESIAAIEAINGDYPKHSKAARELAVEAFDSATVLGAMLNRVG